ncbi:MAG TPA: hypothetical protein VFE50_18000 [Cyclobacteriaceae bacterium]|nr:hypothetical protein [Cyclobacteriaceae bacterium]
MRTHRSASITVRAPIDDAFPLFGPIREKDWAHGWNPDVIYPKDVLVAKHMVFRTQGGLHGSPEAYTWVIVNYDPAKYLIEYMVSAAERFWFITVTCHLADQGTQVTVTYSYTGLTETAIQKNLTAINQIFTSDLKDWETAINYYLSTGKQLTS